MTAVQVRSLKGMLFISISSKGMFEGPNLGCILIRKCFLHQQIDSLVLY
jgi:hypothetical protein